jgi:hypothetical protein
LGRFRRTKIKIEIKMEIEIPKITNVVSEIELKNFWNFLGLDFYNKYYNRRSNCNKEIRETIFNLELRLTPVYKTDDIITKINYQKNINNLWLKYSNRIKNNKKICWFVNNYDDFMSIISYNNYFFCSYNSGCKLCYGLNFRQEYKTEKLKKIDGSYNSVKYVTRLFFDIEPLDHDRELNNIEWNFLTNNYISYLKKILEEYGITRDPLIISSGIGIHLLYNIPFVIISDNKKKWYKENFMNRITNEMSSIYPKIKIDNIFDFTRIFGLPESYNIKRKKQVKIISNPIINNNINIDEDLEKNFLLTINRKFRFGYKKFLKNKKELDIEKTNIDITKKDDEILLAYHNKSCDEKIKYLLRNEPLVLMLLKKCLPSGDRNLKLIYPLKILLKKLGFCETDSFVISLFDNINRVQCDNFSINFPKTDTEFLFFSKKIVNDYFIENNMPEIYK